MNGTEIFKEFKDLAIRICFFISAGETMIADQEHLMQWEGCIREITSNGWVVFEHTAVEAARMQTARSFLNPHCVWVWNIDLLMDGFDPTKYLTCPHCKKDIKMSLMKHGEVE